MKKKSPTERAAEHAQKLKEHQARREAKSSPGPGSYEPQQARSPPKGAGAAFKSSTDRAKTPPSSADITTGGDPGAYETAGHQSLSKHAASTSSFQTSSKKGASGFGGTAKRNLKVAQAHAPTAPSDDIDITPGAGTYDPQVTETGREHDMQTRNGAEAMKSASFASNERPHDSGRTPLSMPTHVHL